MREFIKKHLHRYVSTALLYGIVIFFFADYYHFHLPKLLILFFVILWIAGIRAFDDNRKTPIPYLVVGVISALLIFIIVKSNIHLVAEFDNYYNWLWEMASNVEKLSVSDGVSILYTIISIFLLCILCTPIYLLTKWKQVRYLIAVAGVISCGVMIALQYDMAKMSSICIFAYLFLCLIEFSFEHQYPQEKSKSVAMTTFLSQFVLALLIIFSVLKTSPKPMEFRQLKNLWNQVVRLGENISYNIEDIFHSEVNEDFSLTFSGFSEDQSLGGGVESNSKASLTVEEFYKDALNVYLIGNTKNEFNGEEWVDTIQKDEYLSQYKEYILDIYEFANAIDQNYVPFISQDIMDDRMIEITYNNLRTNTLFYPMKGAYVKSVNHLPAIENSTSNWRLAKRSRRNDSYRTYYLDLRLGTEMMDKFMIEHTKGTYRWGTIDCRNLKQRIYDYVKNPDLEVYDNIGEILTYRAKKINEDYLNIPSNLSQRVIDLSNRLTQGAESDYEKMKLIEAYLNTYTYTTHPSQTPEDSDMVDYFLFESKEGYCTYFATAMAIMARCVGVPSRYVQGFFVPVDNQAGKYVATGDEAHAWVEIYFEGIGWIPFEPTSGYTKCLYKAKDIFQKKASQETSNNIDYAKRAEEIRTEIIEEEPAQVVPTAALTKGKTYLYTILAIMGVLMLSILFSVAYFLIRIRFIHLSYKAAGRKDQMYFILKRILFIFECMDLKIEENATLLMQFESLNQIPGISRQQINFVADRFMILCYGNGELLQDDENEILDFYKTLLFHLKENTKRLHYFMITLKIARIHFDRS